MTTTFPSELLTVFESHFKSLINVYGICELKRYSTFRAFCFGFDLPNFTYSTADFTKTRPPFKNRNVLNGLNATVWVIFKHSDPPLCIIILYLRPQQQLLKYIIQL